MKLPAYPIRLLTLFGLLLVAAPKAAQARCYWRHMEPHHRPSPADISYHPTNGPLLSIPTGKTEEKRIGMLVRTDQGRLVFVVTPFMAGAQHRGMDKFVSQMLEEQLGEKEKIDGYLWSGEFRMRRNPLDPSKPQIVEINPTSGFLTEMLGERSVDPRVNNPETLKTYLDKYQPGLVAKDAKLTPFDAQNPHLDPFMSKFVTDNEAAYRKKLAEWEAGDKADAPPDKPNFRHDIGGPLGNLGNALGILLLSNGYEPTKRETLWKRNLERIARNAPNVLEWARLIDEDGIHLVDNPGAPNEVNHIRRVRIGLDYLVKNNGKLPEGMTIEQLDESFRRMVEFYQGIDKAERKNDTEIFQLRAPHPGGGSGE